MRAALGTGKSLSFVGITFTSTETLGVLMSKLSTTKVQVLDQFEARTDEWSFGAFEKALEQAMGGRYGNYQTAKSTIAEADHDGRWPNTVKRYVLSNYRAFGNSPAELTSISTRILAGLTEEEKSYWRPAANQ